MDNIYHIVSNFWNVASQHRLSAAAIATYFFLVNEANRNRWPPSFPCATELLCTMTGSHKSTVIRARAALKAAGVSSKKRMK